LLVADTDDLRIRMLGRLPQQIAHVEVIEVNAYDAPALHEIKMLNRFPGTLTVTASVCSRFCMIEFLACGQFS